MCPQYGLQLVRDERALKRSDDYALASPKEKRNICYASRRAAEFIGSMDKRGYMATEVRFLGDDAGRRGDVRDVVLTNNLEIIFGFSVKNRHYATKAPRISHTNEWGENWYGVPCSEQYKAETAAIWQRLGELKKQGAYWRDLEDKDSAVYSPLLSAFMDELKRNADPMRLFSFLVAEKDFYKVIKENGHLLIQSFNMNGTLDWGNPVPKPLHHMLLTRESSIRVELTLGDGWALNLRIHNATSKVETSLKFDAVLTGTHYNMSDYQVAY